MTTSEITHSVPLYSLGALLGACVILVIILGIKYVTKKEANNILFCLKNQNDMYRVLNQKAARCIDYTTKIKLLESNKTLLDLIDYFRDWN